MGRVRKPQGAENSGKKNSPALKVSKKILKAEKIKEQLSGKNYSPIVSSNRALVKQGETLLKKKLKTLKKTNNAVAASTDKKADKSKLAKAEGKNTVLLKPGGNETTQSDISANLKESKVDKKPSAALSKKRPNVSKTSAHEKDTLKIPTENTATVGVAHKSKPGKKEVKISLKELSKVDTQDLQSAKGVAKAVKVNKKEIKPPQNLKKRATSEDKSGLDEVKKSKKAKVESTVATEAGSTAQEKPAEELLLHSFIINPRRKALLEKKGKKAEVVSEKKQTPVKTKKLTVVARNKPESSTAEVSNTGKSIKVKREGKKSKSLKLISNVNAAKKPSVKTLRWRRRNRDRGVVVFKNIPHGFYGKEIEKYCSQFGKVTGVYHPVSKNGNSKGYAFVEFAHKDVAQVVAETMDNYVMYYRRMRCEVVPHDRTKPWVFRRTDSVADLAIRRRKEALDERMRDRSQEELAAWQVKKQAQVSQLHKKLKAAGVDYDFKVTDGSEFEETS